MSAHERPATPESAAKMTFEAMEQIELMPRAKFMEQAAVAYSQLRVGAAMLGKTPAELAAVVAAFAVDSGGDGKGMAELFDEIKSTKEWFAGFASVMACIEARTFVAASRVAVAEGLTGQAAQPEPKQPPA